MSSPTEIPTDERSLDKSSTTVLHQPKKYTTSTIHVKPATPIDIAEETPQTLATPTKPTDSFTSETIKLLTSSKMSETLSNDKETEPQSSSLLLTSDSTESVKQTQPKRTELLTGMRSETLEVKNQQATLAKPKDEGNVHRHKLTPHSNLELPSGTSAPVLRHSRRQTSTSNLHQQKTQIPLILSLPGIDMASQKTKEGHSKKVSQTLPVGMIQELAFAQLGRRSLGKALAESGSRSSNKFALTEQKISSSLPTPGMLMRHSKVASTEYNLSKVVTAEIKLREQSILDENVRESVHSALPKASVESHRESLSKFGKKADKVDSEKIAANARKIDKIKSLKSTKLTESDKAILSTNKISLLKRLANYNAAADHTFAKDEGHKLLMQKVKKMAVLEIPEPILASIKREVFPILLVRLCRYGVICSFGL